MTAHGMWRSRRNPRRATRCVWIPPWGGGQGPSCNTRIVIGSVEDRVKIDDARIERPRRLEHPEAAERGAGAVADAHGRGRPGSDPGEERVELSGVALIGPPPRSAATQKLATMLFSPTGSRTPVGRQ